MTGIWITFEVLSLCSDHYASFCPRCTQIIFALLWAYCLSHYKPPASAPYSFVLRNTHHAILFYVSFNLFNPLSFYSQSWGLCKPRLLPSCQQSKREFKYQRQKLISEELLSTEILWRSRADPRKTWNYMPRDARVLLMAFIQSVSQWNWWHTLGLVLVYTDIIEVNER